jgi:hypothetical protein
VATLRTRTGSTAAIAGRVVAAALAACAVVVAILALRGDHRCSEVKADAATSPASRLTAVAAAAGRCGDPRDRVIVALQLIGRGRRDAAAEVARRMTIDSPDDYVGWLAVWNLERDPAALRRAHELNPRGTPAPR